MQSQRQEIIIVKFKRHGHPLNQKSLQKTIKWLSISGDHSLQVLLRKLDQLSLDSSNSEENLQHAIEILSRNSKGLNSYDDLLEETRKRSIFSISPYQTDLASFFVEKPDSRLFKFCPEDRLKTRQVSFRRIIDGQKDVARGVVIGMVYENYSALNINGKQKIILQNEANQFELNFPKNYQHQCLLIPGCNYLAQGRQEGKDLTYVVQRLSLPTLIQEEKNSLLKQKFKQICQNISAGKEQVGFKEDDFLKYNCVYAPPSQHLRPTLILGNVTVNSKTVQRIKRLTDAYPIELACIILMLSPLEHQPINMGLWFKCQVYLIPHLASEGPQLLPKLPLLKTKIPGAKVLTNPARLSLQGREVVLANYPLIRSIFSQSLINFDPQSPGFKSFLKKVNDLIFSQGSIAMGAEHYWPQREYFNISMETLVVVTDNLDVANFQSSLDVPVNSKSRPGGLANTGNFDRDGDFLCVMSWSKSMVQLCNQRKQ